MIYLKIIFLGIIATLVLWGCTELRDFIDNNGLWDYLPLNLRESILCVSILTGVVLALVFIYKCIEKLP